MYSGCNTKLNVMNLNFIISFIYVAHKFNLNAKINNPLKFLANITLTSLCNLDPSELFIFDDLRII